MHRLIEAGLESLTRHRCPDCGGGEFLRGPQGGLALNIACKACGHRFNVTLHQSELIFAQRIDGTGPWPDRGEW
jgi:uncharacterized protein (DUF983 family)